MRSAVGLLPLAAGAPGAAAIAAEGMAIAMEDDASTASRQVARFMIHPVV